ncbi:LysR family transcriptional regulator [Pseudokordiimonas caeni]|uniref:LysR family transcriptional regulator n=1 Tax=Pseudokordiimonas caeni TaxID=2997908 RepID=UPI002810E8A5|nr:LysR family transcriptional regulator [Pseudokordiimonas caeni]
MVELRLWRALVAVAEELNFRRAAERLNISQPALTKQIQELEARLGVALFHREARGVAPTDATCNYLPAVRTLLEEAQALEAKFSAGDPSTKINVRIGALEFLAKRHLPILMQSVRDTFPGARISMIAMNTFETAAATADGKIDLGVARSPVTEPSLIARPFQRGEWVVVLRGDHKLAAKAKVTVADLADDPLIIFSRRLNPGLYDDLIGAITRGGRAPEVAYQAQDPTIGVELALSGVGHFLSVSYILDDLPEGLVARKVEGVGLDAHLDLVWRRDHMSPVLRHLIDLLSSAVATDN